MNLLRLLVVAPPRLLIHQIDRAREKNRAPRLTTTQRTWTYVLMWSGALVVCADLLLR